MIYHSKENTFCDTYPESSLTGKCLDPLYFATLYVVQRHMFYGQRLPRWLMRLILQHHQVAYMDGILVSFYYLTRLQLEEIVLHSHACFRVNNLHRVRFHQAPLTEDKQIQLYRAIDLVNPKVASFVKPTHFVGESQEWYMDAPLWNDKKHAIFAHVKALEQSVAHLTLRIR